MYINCSDSLCHRHSKSFDIHCNSEKRANANVGIDLKYQNKMFPT